MSSFDTVVGHCPHCAHPLEVQSKAGDCELITYSTAGVPAEIAHDLEGVGGLCSNCRKPWKLVCKAIQRSWPMAFEVPEDE
jgi:uncharacterized protein YbaR (Trm112 family)